MRVPDETETLHAVIARPDVLERLCAAQESLARTQLAQLELNNSQRHFQANQTTLLRGIAFISLVAAVLSFGALVAVLAS